MTAVARGIADARVFNALPPGFAFLTRPVNEARTRPERRAWGVWRRQTKRQRVGDARQQGHCITSVTERMSD